jgi:hypothetical protein
MAKKKRSCWEWDVVGEVVHAPKKVVPGRANERRYSLLACPLGCGERVEVLTEKLKSHRSVACRIHLKHCPKLSEEQRAVFAHDKEGEGQKTTRRTLSRPPSWIEGQSVDEYIESFSFKRAETVADV